MHVDIDCSSVNVEKQADERVLMLHQAVSVSVLDSARDDAALNIASVDIVILKSSVSAGDRGLSDESVDMNSILPVIRLDKLRHNLSSVDMINAVPEISRPGRLKLCLPAGQKPEGNGRIGQNKLLHKCAYMGSLRHGGLQKFGTRRRIVEKVPDDDRCTIRRSDCFVYARPPALDDIPASRKISRSLGQNLDAADRCDRGERLPPETEGGKGVEIIDRLDLRSRVALKRKRQIIRRHALPIIRDPNHGNTAIPDFNGDPVCSRINCIFRQLLHDRCRTLDDLPGRNLVNG